MRVSNAALMLVAIVSFSSASGAATPDQQCHARLYGAMAKLESCVTNSLGKFLKGADVAKLQSGLGQCLERSQRKWTSIELRAAGDGSICAGPRYVDNGDGTVTDNRTGLQWVTTTDDDTVRDKDNGYEWTAVSPFGETADGTVFTVHLAQLNAGCFAGHCDWRLPSMAELISILLDPYPCSPPCLDAIFGPLGSDTAYWSSTVDLSEPTGAWNVIFSGGSVNRNTKGSDLPARAVRGGL